MVKTAVRDDTLVWRFESLLHVALRLGTSFRVHFRRLRPPRAVSAQYEIVSFRWRDGDPALSDRWVVRRRSWAAFPPTAFAVSPSPSDVPPRRSRSSARPHRSAD